MIFKLPWHRIIRTPFLSLKLVRYMSCEENLVIQTMNSLYQDFSTEKSYMRYSQSLSEAMKICGKQRSILNAKKLHGHLISTGFISSVFLQNHLLNMYSNCGLIEDSSRVFNEIENPNVFSWNTMINGLSDLGMIEKARQLFDEMPERDCVSWNTMMSCYFQNGKVEETIKVFFIMFKDYIYCPDLYSFSYVIKACGSLRLLKLGLVLHCLVEKFSYGKDPFIQVSILDMYVKCGAVDLADKVFKRIQSPSLFCWNNMVYGYSKAYGVGRAIELFEQMPERDTVSWNTIISILSQHGFGVNTLSMFMEMCAHGCEPNSVTYASVLSSCASILDVQWGRHIHARIVRSEPSLDVFVGSTLIDMYAKFGHLETAKRVFSNLPERNTVSWTSLIGGFAQFEFEEEALVLFDQMRKVAVASDQFTVATILGVCSSRKYTCFGTQLHAHSIKIGLDYAIPVSNALVIMYFKCDNSQMANHVFRHMPLRDIISWTAMISAYSQKGDIGSAREYFDKMPQRNVITWNSMLAAYIQHGHWEEGLKLYKVMLLQDNVMPDWVTFSTLFGACNDFASLRLGNQIIAQAVKSGFDSDVSVANGIVTMYSKCGQFEKARKVFDSIVYKDLVSWNAMITSYALNGQGKSVVQIFENMLTSGVIPDHISYIGLLSGCSHSGLVSEGKYYFNSMTKNHGILRSSEHYTCIVDLLGRAGFLEEAKKVIEEMPIQPDSAVWVALLSACCTHGDSKLAEYAVKHLQELDLKDSGSYVLLANVYAETGDLNGVVKVRAMMRDRGIRKNPGCSWIEVGNTVHVFTADDASHPQINEVHRMVEEVLKKIEDTGKYVKDYSSSRYRGCHSEKLAVAFGLIHLPSWMPIHVMKNLRICSDCHTVIKLTSLVTARELVVRDANRFHHFRNGTCSCEDYW